MHSVYDVLLEIKPSEEETQLMPIISDVPSSAHPWFWIEKKMMEFRVNTQLFLHTILWFFGSLLMGTHICPPHVYGLGAPSLHFLEQLSWKRPSPKNHLRFIYSLEMENWVKYGMKIFKFLWLNFF